MREMLDRFMAWDGEPYEAIMVEYVDPVNGGPVYKTMTFFAQLLRAGERTRPMQQNASLVCTPMEGAGYSIIEGQRFDWGLNDTLAIPGGNWYEHVNRSDSEPAVLFIGSDEPTLKALCFYRKFGKTESGDVVQLA